MNDSSNTVDLERFRKAQQNFGTYQRAMAEIRNGRKETHWMWYIFPQMHGLGISSMSQHYAIHGLEEAKAYLNDPYLGGNLREISQVLMALDTDNAYEIFGSPDDIKLRSSMTLFAAAAGEGSVFARVLEKFFGGGYDPLTLHLLGH